MDESVTVAAGDVYGQSKWQAEQLVLHGGYVPHPVVIRPSMVYGSTDKGNLPRMIRAIQRGWFPPLPHSPHCRSMVHVEDVVQAALLAAEQAAAAGQIYIVTDEQAYTTRQLYDWIRAALGLAPFNASVPLPLLHALARVGDGIGHVRGRRFVFDTDALEKLTGPALYSSAKIRQQLGFSPQMTLERALPSIIDYLFPAAC
jgi:nucleoside-diphosphate-sugar epimerase